MKNKDRGYRERRKSRLKHELIWGTLFLFFLILCNKLLLWLYYLMPFVTHTSLSEDSIAQIIIIIISLFSAGILTRKLFGPITFNQDN